MAVSNSLMGLHVMAVNVACGYSIYLWQVKALPCSFKLKTYGKTKPTAGICLYSCSSLTFIV